MDWGLVLLTFLCFAGGIFLSRWQSRRHFRANVAERMAREVEKELARRAVEKFTDDYKQELDTKTGSASSASKGAG